MNTNDMNNVITALDHATAQSDRWLFLAMLVIGGLGAVFIWRWMVSDRNKLSERLTAMTDRHISVTEKLADLIARNSEVVNRNSEVVTHNSEMLNRVDRKLPNL